MSQGSVIGPSTVVRGSVRGQGSLEIAGRVEGDVDVTGNVSVGETGAVLGNISGANVSVQGAVQGDLYGTEAVLIERGGKVVGNLSAPRIGIASGALVRGNVRTENEPALTGARKPLQSPAPRPAPFVAKPVAKVEPKPPAVVAAKASPVLAPTKPVVAAVPAKSEPQAAPPPRKDEREQDQRRPPPPVLPSMGKGAKAKLKKSREE